MTEQLPSYAIAPSWARVVADELEADLARVKVLQAPGDEARFRSASSSSATTMAQLVRTPWPISARLHKRVTVPSSAMERKMCGLSLSPPFIAAPLYFFSCANAGNGTRT